KAIRDRKAPPKPGDDIILKVITDGRFAPIDMRFVDSTLPSDPNSKLNRMLDDLISAYHETANNEYMTSGVVDENKGSSLMLFTNIGLGEQSAKNRGFDMKAWIEKRLIDGGVKREHIAFMRDNKAHSKKEKLFDDMRQGRKRILIGGKDMETGVNAQKRLTHLFHLDSVWFPSTVEQREGRIIRQGNQNRTVDIRGYATKGSYDSTMWGTVARKARFIEQAFRGDSSVRSMEDVSEASAFEMAAALASGDERYLKLAGLKGDVERLGRLYSAHIDEQKRFAREKAHLESSNKLSASEIEQINAAIAQRKPIKAGEFLANVGKNTFDNRDEFSKALFEKFKEVAESYKADEIELGSIAGFPIVYNGVELRGGNFAADLRVDLPIDVEPLAIFPIDPAYSITGIATRAVNQTNALDRELISRKNDIEQNTKDLARIGRRIGASFPEMAELNEKQQALNELEQELNAEGNADDDLSQTDNQDTDNKPKFSQSSTIG
ncbi:MAG TPA: helicase-related protein, partial [Agitococcus sp.]|nr:helicase-related protein [Agitococcus sp.]